VADTPEAREKRYSTASQIAEHGLEPIAGSMPAKLSGDERVRGYCEALIRQQRPAGLIGALKAMAGREDLQSWLTAVDIPMCVVHGNADALIPVDRGREAAAANPHARLTELAGIGHMPMMENPQVTAGALRGLG
jgi:pimeloyl-ACP methyl ester carboxylesterase